MKKLLNSFVILACVMFVFEAPAKAEIIKIGFTGQVDYIQDPYNLLEGAIPQNSSITGFYVYNSATPDSGPWPEVSMYVHTDAPYGMSFTIAGLTFQTDPENVNFSISLANNYGSSYDCYTIHSVNNLSLDNGLTIDVLHWQLDDYSGTALSSTELPLEQPDLSKWQFNRFEIMGGIHVKPKPFTIYGYIKSVYLVPEPSSILIIALGGILLRRKFKVS